MPIDDYEFDSSDTTITPDYIDQIIKIDMNTRSIVVETDEFSLLGKSIVLTIKPISQLINESKVLV